MCRVVRSCPRPSGTFLKQKRRPAHGILVPFKMPLEFSSPCRSELRSKISVRGDQVQKLLGRGTSL